MSEQEANDASQSDSDPATESVPRKRVQSEIEFPYTDLEQAAGLPQALHNFLGGEADDQELAGSLNQTADGGTYRSRRSAARMFGLIDVTLGRITLTRLGKELTDESTASKARAEAFLKPALYAAMYDKCRGTLLPPPAAIERMMEMLGVSPKQKERARQAFQKSATYAGFFDASTGRLIKPSNLSNPADDQGGPKKAENHEPVGDSRGDRNGKENQDSLDPLLVALLHKIPKKGDPWPAAKRVRWFRAFAINVSQVYDDEDPVELKIDLSIDES